PPVLIQPSSFPRTCKPPDLPPSPTRRSSDLPSPDTDTGPSDATGSPSQALFANSFQLTDPPACAPNSPASEALSLNVAPTTPERSEEQTAELQSRGQPASRPLLEKKNTPTLSPLPP